MSCGGDKVVRIYVLQYYELNKSVSEFHSPLTTYTASCFALFLFFLQNI